MDVICCRNGRLMVLVFPLPPLSFHSGYTLISACLFHHAKDPAWRQFHRFIIENTLICKLAGRKT